MKLVAAPAYRGTIGPSAREPALLTYPARFMPAFRQNPDHVVVASYRSAKG